MKLTCPHCGGRALSVWAKLTLGPIAQRSCMRCGLAVGAAVLPALAALQPCALVVLLMLTRVMRDPVTMTASSLAAFALTCVLYLWYVPLVPRELTRRDAVEAARRSSPTLPRD